MHKASIEGERDFPCASAILLAAALAGLGLPSAASAATYVETTDFSNQENTATNIGTNYTIVDGTLNNSPGGDNADYFELTGLSANSSAGINFHFLDAVGSQTYIYVVVDNTAFKDLYADELGPINAGGTINVSTAVTVPANGDLIFGASYAESYGSGSYSFVLPEPTSGAAVMAISALAALKRRRTGIGSTADQATGD